MTGNLRRKSYSEQLETNARAVDKPSAVLSSDFSGSGSRLLSTVENDFCHSRLASKNYFKG